MEAKTISNETVIIEVERKRTTIVGFLTRSLFFIIGIAGMAITALLFMSIIGILPGLSMGVISMGFFSAAIGRQRVKCPHCNRTIYVPKRSENFECPKCKRMTVINWK